MINLEITIPAFAHSAQEAEISESLVGLVVTSRTARTTWLILKKKKERKRRKEEKEKYLLLVSIYSNTESYLLRLSEWTSIQLFVGVFVYSTVGRSQKITCRSQFSISIIRKCSSVGRMLVQHAQSPEFSSKHCIN